MATPAMCRIAVVVDDAKAFVTDAEALLGLRFVSPDLDEQFTAFSVAFGEHGLMAIELHEDVPFARDGRLIEVAIDVASADSTKELLVAGGYRPLVTNHLPAPDADEYLFGRDFHGIPLMVCTAGDNETQMRVQGPFRELEQTPMPKIDRVTLAVDNLHPVAADFTRFFDMRFVPADPEGLGGEALTGPHRIKLVERSRSGLEAQFQPPLASIDLMVDDVEAQRGRLEAAGYAVLHRHRLADGFAYYFGSAFHGVPLTIYPAAADSEFSKPHD